jgi:transcriptional regulator with XRE-family HTH domain
VNFIPAAGTFPKHRQVPWRNRIHAKNPTVRFLFEEMLRKRVSMRVVSKRSGISRSALQHWLKGETEPTIGNMEAALNVIGYTLKPTELPRRVP